METERARVRRRSAVVINYSCLALMNVCFYIVYKFRDMTHLVDVAGIGALVMVGITFARLHAKTGLWKLTHAKADVLDERQLQITHHALGRSYAWFTVVCLTIMMANAVTYRLGPGLDIVLTVPLVASLIYFAHTLPGSVLAWTEMEVPGEAQ